VDVSGMEGRDPVDDFEKINAELAAYSTKLARRRQLVVANKMDLPGSAENFARLKEHVEKFGCEITSVSAATGQGLKELMARTYKMVQEYEPEPEEENVLPGETVSPDSFEVVGGNDTDYEVRGKNIERLVAMTNFDNEEALYRFQLIWKRLGIEEKLKEAGIREGETVRILDMVFSYKENPY